MKRFVTIFLLIYAISAAADVIDCNAWPFLLQHSCKRLKQIVNDGKTELYLTGYSWHNRYTYTRERLKHYNELAYGGGFGKGIYDEDGDWQGIASFVFLDSHKFPEPVAGYAFIKMHHFNENTRLGVGYSLLVTGRPDVFYGRPFPGILPWVYFSYRHLTICSTYIPGSIGTGNVLFTLVKWTF